LEKYSGSEYDIINKNNLVGKTHKLKITGKKVVQENKRLALDN